MKYLVLDSGVFNLKAGFATDTFPRCLANRVTKSKSVKTRVFVSDQLENDCNNLTGLFYLLPFQKGYLLNWEIQRKVWDYVFGKQCLNVKYSDTCLIITEPYFNFHSIQEGMIETMMEEYGFHSLYRCYPSDLSYYHYTKLNESAKCCLVVDSGYSFTHIVPYCMGRAVKEAIMRIDVGGKLLTNHLKEIISYRQLMVMDETYVINQMKEDVCYVSTQFDADMRTSLLRGKENPLARDYVLPDFADIRRGFVRDPNKAQQKDSKSSGNSTEQVIRMNNERFAVPEILLNPSDVGIPQMGIAEAIVHCVNRMPEVLRPHFYENIVLTGGSCLFPGFADRMRSEVRQSIPSEYQVHVFMPDNPVAFAWEGGKLLTRDPDFKHWCLTQQEYRQHPLSYCLERFDV